MASTYLQRTFTAGDRKTYTFSTWVKRANLNGVYQSIITAQSADHGVFFSSTNTIELYFTSGGLAITTNAVYRDTSAWYHIVVAVDTTQATESDRVKLYVNGIQETSFSATNYPSQNYDTLFNNSGGTMRLGNHGTSSFYLDGQMTHVHFIDGTAYDADTFGETDATTGIWKPKTAPSVTYGTNGFFLKFENSGAFGTDSSGNSNNFTVNGTMTQTIDTPSNVFATWNPLIVANYQPSFSNGNTRIQFSTSGSTNQASSTLAANSGKYYSEFKIDASGTIVIGITASQDAGGNSFPGRTSQSWGMLHTGAVYVNDNTSTYPSYGDSFTTGDIIGIAMDLDNNYLYFSKNGTWQNSADPTSGATGTGAIDISSSSASDMMFSSAVETGSCAVSANFGNGYFGTTAVSSAENPDDGIGIFEYSVPTGYKALCTKSINAQEYD